MVLPAGHRRNRGSCRKHAGDTGRLLTNAFPNGQRTVLQWLGTNNDVRLASIHHLDPASATLSKFDHAYDADGQLTAWTQQAGNVSTNVYSLGYDRAGQLLDAVLRQAGPAGALVKRYAYAYDAAGNRTGEQVDTHPAAETANALNQITARAGGPCFRHRAGRTR